VILALKQSGDAHLKFAGFSYSTSDSVTFGVGISFTNANGGFSAGGTTTESSGGSTTFPNMVGAGNNYLEGDGVYNDNFYTCSTPVGTLYQFWELDPAGVGSDFGTPGAEPVGIGDCLTTQPGETFTYTIGAQETFTSGVNLSALGYGINLSAQNGFSTQSVITYAFGSSSAPVCGQANYPNVPNVYIGVVGVH
jgi:hypothetical protein